MMLIWEWCSLEHLGRRLGRQKRGQRWLISPLRRPRNWRYKRRLTINLQVIETGLGYQEESLADYLGTTRTYIDNGIEVPVTLTMTGIMAAAHGVPYSCFRAAMCRPMNTAHPFCATSTSSGITKPRPSRLRLRSIRMVFFHRPPVQRIRPLIRSTRHQIPVASLSTWDNSLSIWPSKPKTQRSR